MGLLDSFKREYIYIVSVARTLVRMRRVGPDSRRTIVDIVEEFAAKKPDNSAVLYQGSTVTYRQLDEGANRTARWAQSQGIKRGDAVALLMENRPEYLMTWLGLHKLGAVAALVNTNLKGAALAHSIAILGARHAIVGVELNEAYDEAVAQIDPKPLAWAAGGTFAGARDFDAALASLSPAPFDKGARAGLSGKDGAFYIYTSGTAGLPKAAKFSHMRTLYMMYGFAGAMNASTRDRIYCTLPLYHATGGICAVGMAFITGGTFILRRKFSAHEFWEDCRAYRATIFPYIGELCRYLLSTASSPAEADHRLRLCCGNGLGGDIWQAFQDRFRIPHILEFYAATEANFSLYNVDEQPGSIGRIPSFLAHRFPIQLIKVDAGTLEPIRDSKELCVPAATGEPGEAVFKIAANANAGAASFEGYTSAQETDKKTLRGVKTKDDVWYRSGDLVKRDGKGFFYFAGRLGDTFRWKGENVSTQEVAQTIAAFPGVLEAAVYGVALPNADGRAGMAALSIDGAFDLKAFKAYMDERLPRYAQPLFLRIVDQLELTATFRPQKGGFASQGANPATVPDPLYFNDEASGGFVTLDASLYEAIAAGRVRL